MRFIFKIIALPFYLILAPLAAIVEFLVNIGNVVLWVLSGIFVIMSVVTFIWSVEVLSMSDLDFRIAVSDLAVAFLISPYGIPKLLTAIVCGLHSIKDGLHFFITS